MLRGSVGKFFYRRLPVRIFLGVSKKTPDKGGEVTAQPHSTAQPSTAKIVQPGTDSLSFFGGDGDGDITDGGIVVEFNQSVDLFMSW